VIYYTSDIYQVSDKYEKSLTRKTKPSWWKRAIERNWFCFFKGCPSDESYLPTRAVKDEAAWRFRRAGR